MSYQETQSLIAIKILVLNLFHQTKMANYSPQARQLKTRKRKRLFSCSSELPLEEFWNEWGVQWLHSPWKSNHWTSEINFLNSHLNLLGTVLRAFSNWKNIQENNKTCCSPHRKRLYRFNFGPAYKLFPPSFLKSADFIRICGAS